jgi:hypothetical protein
MPDVKRLVARIGDNGSERTFKGRTAWALNRLVTAGERGVTPIEHPGPRWSDYIFKLRRAGVPVETIDEKHGGTYSGSHARYRLLVPVEVVSTEMAP